MLVYLPICGFLDSTQKNVFGLNPADMYWKTVTPHEVAHQWWGQTVGFRSYRDQWMSEGFADASAAMFLLTTRPKPDEYLQFWKEARRDLTEKNAQGFRPIDVGPVTMGFRLSSEKTGWGVYRNLIYPKGAYILHMIQMMMWTQRDGDAAFSAMMRDFVSTYRLKPATTEDFKKMVEKHMTHGMDLENNHTMDWFFREYVYGTALPNYHFDAQLTPNGDTTTLHFKLTQSAVTDGYKNTVPLYLELADGRVLKLGGIVVTGNSSIEQTVPLPHLPAPVKKATINYYYDVLCTEN
jgi:aminopeptidase N